MSSTAVKHDLVADRGAPFDETFAKIGEDWSSATLFMQVRQYPDAPGSPIINLSVGSGITLQYAGTATIAAHIAAGRLPQTIKDVINPTTGVNYVDADSVLLSKANAHISGTVMGLASYYPPELGDDVDLAYDFRVNTAGGLVVSASKLFYGKFSVRGTVTV